MLIGVAVGSTYLAAAAVLHFRNLQSWFLADDVIVLARISDLNLSQVLTVGQLFGNFVPAMWVSLWLDWRLFGFLPEGYRIHSLLACVVVAWLVWLLMRRWCREEIAILAGACFLLAPASVAVTSWISTRHYVEGMIPCLLAALLLRRYLDAPSARVAAAIAALYFLACIFKEVFIVLPVALVFLPVPGLWHRTRGPAGRWSLRTLLRDRMFLARLQLAAMLWAALTTYVAWRLAAVGSVLVKTGFDWPVSHRLEYFVSAWPRFTGWMLDSTQSGSVWSISFFVVHALALVGLVALAHRGWLVALFGVTLFAAASLPAAMILAHIRFLEIANHFCLRLVHAPFVVVLLLGTWGVGRLAPRFLAAGVLLLLLAFTSFQGWHAIVPWTLIASKTEAAAAVYRTWWDQRAVVVTDFNPWLHVGLREIWSREHGQPQTLARVITTRRSFDYDRSLRADDPLVTADDVTYVEDLQWRGSTQLLSKEEFGAKYVDR